MSVEFTNTVGQKVSFGIPAGVTNLAQKTVSIWFNLDAWPAEKFLRLVDKDGGSNKGWSVDLANIGGFVERIAYFHRWSGDDGGWYSNDSAVTAGATNHLAVTYDRTNTANNPLFYLNGSSIAVNETSTPTGTTESDVLESLAIGNSDGGTGSVPYDGLILELVIASVIWTPGEIASKYATRSAGGRGQRGVRFYAGLIGASGLQSYDGVSLGADNKLVDQIGGAQGTPTGNPIGHAGVFLAGGGWG